MFVDIVNEKGIDSVMVVCGCDGVVVFLVGSILDLGFDGFGVNLD